MTDKGHFVAQTAGAIHDRVLRLPQVLEIVPVSKSTWWHGVRIGRYPQSVRLGQRAVGWRASDIQKLIAALGKE
jgi:predicted DNA-binding transcriptional regulator AlpA